MLTIGAVNVPTTDDEPAGVVTTTSASPAMTAGALTVICVSELDTIAALWPRKVTPVTPSKWEPAITRGQKCSTLNYLACANRPISVCRRFRGDSDDRLPSGLNTASRGFIRLRTSSNCLIDA